MAGKLKEFVVNGVLISTGILLVTKLLGWVGTLNSFIPKVLTIGGLGWTVGLAVATGLAVILVNWVKDKFPTLK